MFNRYNQDPVGKALWTANFMLRLGLNKLLPWLFAPPAFMMMQVYDGGGQGGAEESTGEGGEGKGRRGKVLDKLLPWLFAPHAFMMMQVYGGGRQGRGRGGETRWGQRGARRVPLGIRAIQVGGMTGFLAPPDVVRGGVRGEEGARHRGVAGKRAARGFAQPAC